MRDRKRKDGWREGDEGEQTREKWDSEAKKDISNFRKLYKKGSVELVQ